MTATLDADLTTSIYKFDAVEPDKKEKYDKEMRGILEAMRAAYRLESLNSNSSSQEVYEAILRLPCKYL